MLRHSAPRHKTARRSTTVSSEVRPASMAAHTGTLERGALQRLQQSTDLRKRRLARSGSLDRIKQFPAYLCSTKVVPHVLNTAVQTGIEQALGLVRSHALVVAVYLTLFTLLVQLVALTCVLLAGAVPPGLVFMLASLCFMSVMAAKTIAHDSAHNRP